MPIWSPGRSPFDGLLVPGSTHPPKKYPSAPPPPPPLGKKENTHTDETSRKNRFPQNISKISPKSYLGRDPFNQNSNRSDRENWSTSKGGPVFSKLFRFDRTDPLSFGPKFPEILVEWIAPLDNSDDQPDLAPSPYRPSFQESPCLDSTMSPFRKFLFWSF